MAEFKFLCPQCGQQIQGDTGYSGMQINCPACKQAIVVPPASSGLSTRQDAAAPVAERPFSGVPAAHAPTPANSRTLRNVLVIAASVVVLAGLVIGGWFCYSQLKHHQAGPNLIGWWKLDDGSGTVAKDSSRAFKCNVGELVGDPKWAKGRKGGALRLDGSQYVSLGNILQGSYTEITIACWVKHRQSQWQNIVERSVWDKSDGIGLMMDYNQTSVSFGHYGLGAVTSIANVQDDQWHHVAGAMRQSGSDYVYSIYVDGQLDNTATNSTGLTQTENGWAIGARYDGTWGYRGLVEDVRIYDRTLSASEIRAIYAGQQ